MHILYTLQRFRLLLPRIKLIVSANLAKQDHQMNSTFYLLADTLRYSIFAEIMCLVPASHMQPRCQGVKWRTCPERPRLYVTSYRDVGTQIPWPAPIGIASSKGGEHKFRQWRCTSNPLKKSARTQITARKNGNHTCSRRVWFKLNACGDLHFVSKLATTTA